VDGAPLQYTIAPSVNYSGQHISYELELVFGDIRAVFLRTTLNW
jgi:hypothetical protein